MFSRPVQRAAASTATTSAMPSSADPVSGSIVPAIAHSIGTTLPVGAPARDATNAAPPNRTGLPDALKRGVEALSGIAIDDVRVHRNSARPAALGAHAYAQGSHIHLAPGQDHNLPHEAWHVVQQKQGRVRATMQLKGGIPVNGDAALEREADAMGARAASVPLAAVAPPLSAEAVPGAPVQRLASVGVVQRQLEAVANQNHFIDNRDPTQRRFTPHHGNGALTGTYTCQDNFQYHYDDATKRYRVLSNNNNAAGYNNTETYWDVANQREMRKVNSAPDNQQRRVHHYLSGGQRFHYSAANNHFQALPQSASNVDTRGQFVDHFNRVLTPNNEGVDKQYAVTKAGRDYIVPYKRLGNAFGAGLPALYGGNVDAHETADQALARETREESGNRLAIGAHGAQLMQVQAAWDPQGDEHQDLNRYTIRNATVNANANNHVQRHEMSGEMRFTASDFVGHTANPAATTARLLARFTQHVGANSPHGQHVAALGQQARNKWAGSHSMTALAGQIAADVQQYEGGRDGARAGQALGNAPHAEEAQGHGMYTAGAAAARAGNANANHAEQAYGVGHDDYTAGIAAARAGAGAGQHAAHNQAMADYTAGLAAAQAGQAAGQHAAHNHAMADYAAGLAAAQAGQAAGAHHANATAHAEYQAGRAHGQAGQAAQSQNAAYLQGHAAALAAAQVNGQANANGGGGGAP